MRALALAVAILACATACAGSEGAECELDDECAVGLTCFADICQDLGTPEGTITFEVLPQPATGLQPATFPMAEQPLRFGFCAPAAIVGRVEGQAKVLVRGVAAGLGGEKQRWQQEVRSDFRLPLPPGTWQLTFLLAAGAGQILPPPEPLLVRLARCETLDLGEIVPTGEIHVARFGVVIDPVRDPRPRCGVLASIHDPLTGEALSRALPIEKKPGLGCTMPPVHGDGDRDGGGEGWELPFRPPTGDEIELRLVSADGSRPTIAELRYLAADGPSVDLGLVGVGSEAVLERIRIEVLGPEGTPVEGAGILARGTMPDELGTFAPPLAADLGGGLYELWLLPGAYEIRVEPPFDLHAATTRCLEPPEGGQCEQLLQVEPGLPLDRLARLPPPLLLSGRVLDPDRAPLSGARVLALPLGEGRSAFAFSGAGGRYELSLDPGEYELLVQGGGMAWRRLVMDGALLVDERLDLQLPPAARVVGTVQATRDGKQVPLHRALVRAWSVGDARQQVVGETVTDAQGRFSFVLPAGP